jgi:hypothetical protein
VSVVDPLNTAPIQQFIQQVKTAENSRAKDLRLDITQAKNLAFTLGIVMSRLQGDLEKLVANSKTSESDDVIEVQLDGGSGWK